MGIFERSILTLLLKTKLRNKHSLGLLVLDHVDELRLHELPVEVGDRVLKRILEALAALALVAAGLETSTQDGNAL